MTTPSEGTPTEGAPATPAEPAAAPAAPAAPAAAAPAEPAAPAEYKFAAPEGVTYDTALVEQITSIAKENKLTVEAAQKLLDHQHSLIAAQQKTLDETVAGWKQALATDAEVGGDKLEQSRATANKVIALGPKELPELLESSGMINHPVVFKFLHTVGKMLSEDSFVKSGAQPNSGAGRSLAKVLYPNNA